METRISLNELLVASPCPMSWDTMRGDDQARFSDQCQKHVYNFAAMTTAEGLALIERAVEAHVDNERAVLSALSDDVLRNLDTQLAHLLRALERGADGDRDGAALAA